MKSDELKSLCVSALEDMKGTDIEVLDVREMTGVTDYMVVCTGTSSRHVKSLAYNVEMEGKQAGERPLGVEGDNTSDWVLVDFGDVVVHVMLAETRQFYDIERLWSVVPGRDGES